MLAIPKHLTFILATVIFAIAVALLLIFWYRLPDSAKQGDVKGSQVTAEQKQQLFETCLAGQLGAENYLRYKNGEQTVLDEESERIGVCYSILAQPSRSADR